MIRYFKIFIFVACLFPLAQLLWKFKHETLSANPIEDITHETGLWTLRFLVITLSLTPIRQITGQNQVIRFRRMWGLFAFFYGTLHLVTYLWLDQFFVWSDILKDVIKRPFITVGFIAFVLMVPLAVTSTRKAVARMGGKNWQRLHRLVYASAILGVVHYFWLVKADTFDPKVYAVLVAVLLGYRILKSVTHVKAG